MKIWARIRKENKTAAQYVTEVSAKSASEVKDWYEPLSVICRELNLARPVVLKKHIRDLEEFNHTAFRPGDFMETVDFDRLEIELY